MALLVVHGEKSRELGRNQTCNANLLYLSSITWVGKVYAF